MTKRERGKQRLRVLGEYLKLVPDESFDMCFWRGKKNAKGHVKTDYRAKIGACGTVACAFGHAIEIFPELSLVKVSPFKGTRGEYDVAYAEGDSLPTFYNDPLDAARHFFSISESKAAQLFLPSDVASVSKATVIDRILAEAN